ncbi:glycosyltransferase [Polyangium aurulentum]|uniref:glycosyltransferase n=1 Tax=Polyangium aurulentum TaxID=2567896 RepID=UPI0010AECD16|nr:glycosyltransferase [Polyangium aurulentum]UQA56714.1 glycosyltransferase [Polyangium aurulentum]
MPHTILCFSSQRWDDPMWTNKQHIMSRLAREHRVIHVDFGAPPLEKYIFDRARVKPADLLHPLRLLTDGVVHRGGGLHVSSSWIPLPLLALPRENRVRDFFQFDAKIWMLRQFLARERIEDPILWVYHPGYADALASLPRKLLVYDCVDEYSAFPTNKGRAWIAEREKRLCEAADLVFTTSNTLYDKKKPYNPENTHLVHNVGDAEHFRAAMREDTPVPKEIARLPRPVLGFVGAVSDYKLDMDWILHAARRRPDWSFAIIGPVGVADPTTSTAALRKQPNVHLIGHRPYAELPAYVKGFDVALIPYRINEYTRSVFPIKFFELLATGKPVVISNLPSLEEFYPHVLVATTADEFVQRCEQALREGDQGREARVALAEANSWPKRIGTLMGLIEAKLADKARAANARA